MTGEAKREALPTWVLALVTTAALLALVAYSAWQRWDALAVSPFPLGVDGYFYPIQVRSLMEQHTLQYPASPLTFWFMLPFAQATDPIVGAKLGAAIGGALIALPAYAVGARLGRSRGAGYIAAVLASQLAASQYLSIEFVKQGFGLTVAMTALWLLLRALERPSNARVLIALLGFVAALATHKLAGGLVVVVAVPGIIEEARGRGALRGRRLLYLMVGLIATGGALVLLGLLLPQRFLGEQDVSLLRALFTDTPEWDLPALALPRYRLLFDREALIGGVAAIAALVLVLVVPYDRKAYGPRIVAWISIVLALAIELPWLAVDDPQGLGFRLRLAAFVPASLCAAIAIGAIGSLIKEPVAALLRDAILLVAAAILVVLIPVDRAEGRVLTHPALATAAMAASGEIPKNATVIVPERHILFMVAWYTRAKVSLHPDDVPPQERVRLMPLSFIGMGSPLDRVLDEARREPGIAPPIGFHPRHRNGLVLVTEATWQWILARLGDQGTYWAKWPTI
ncbi:MAG TPA: glycosyltransferase family 39 protein [Kofleriaceae bacterium]|nr:glycosyltransferase family 39 protein [Kofleriaceae bacterium]